MAACSSLPPDPYAQAELERLREELVSAKARSTSRSQKRLAFSRFLTTCRLPGSPVKSTRSSWQQSSRAPSRNWPSCRRAWHVFAWSRSCDVLSDEDRLCARLPFKTPSLPGNQVRSTQCGPWQEMEAAVRRLYIVCRNGVKLVFRPPLPPPPPKPGPMALPPEAHLSELDRLDAQDVQVGHKWPTCSSLPPDPYAQAELERLREELVSAKARSTPRSQKRLAFSRFLTTCRLPGSPVKSTRSSWQQSSRAPSGNWPSCRCA